MVSYSHSTKFGKSLFNKFWGLLCQPVRPESNRSHFNQFSMLDSALLFFVKTRRWLRKNNFKIIFAPFLWSRAVTRPNLVNLYLTFWGVLSESVHPKSNILAAFLCSIVLVGFFLKLAFE